MRTKTGARALRRPRLTRRAVGRFPHDPDSRSEEMAGILKMRTHECYSQYFYHLRGILWARNNRESRVHGELDLVQLYSRRSRGGIVAPVLSGLRDQLSEREEGGALSPVPLSALCLPLWQSGHRVA